MRELALNRKQRFRLRQQLKHTHDAALYRRTLALLELDQGKPIAQIARSLGVTRQSIYNWLEAYTASFDPRALVDETRSGRPSTWTPDVDQLLQTLLQESPADWNYPAVNWTVALLRQQLATWDGRWVSQDTIRRRLQEMGYVWKRTRYVLPPDPNKEKKTADSSAA